MIGMGAFGTVRSCHERSTNQKYAVKSILKMGNVKNAQLLKNEIALVQRVRHTNVVHIIDAIQDSEYNILLWKSVKVVVSMQGGSFICCVSCSILMYYMKLVLISLPHYRFIS